MNTILLTSVSIFQRVELFIKQLIFQPTNINSVTLSLNQLFLPFFLHYNESYDYSESIQAFVGATKATVGNLIPETVIWDNVLTSEFLLCLNSYRERIILSLQLQQRQELENRYQLIEYVTQLTNHYSRLLFVRVDLGYLVKQMGNISLEDFYQHLTRLRELISNKQTCFEDLQGYVWALEQGIDRNVHCHLLLMYDGSKRQNDSFIGKSVGKKWVKITSNQGSYYNCNNRKYKDFFQQRNQLGIGMIHRDNPLEVQNAIRVASYLTEPDKQDQNIVVKIPNMRTFGKGQFNVAWRRGIFS